MRSRVQTASIDRCVLVISNDQMLLNLHKKNWTDGLKVQQYDAHSNINEKTVAELVSLAKLYNKA
eukprot:8339181-Ditylum_brightwellii.AAC.1